MNQRYATVVNPLWAVLNFKVKDYVLKFFYSHDMVRMKFTVGNRAHFSDIWWKFSEPGETNDSTFELKLSCQGNAFGNIHVLPVMG